jgi:hypothetical protein
MDEMKFFTLLISKIYKYISLFGVALSTYNTDRLYLLLKLLRANKGICACEMKRKVK